MSPLPELPDGFHLHHLAEVDSTNEEARRHADAGAPDRTLIWAERQLAGRGRRGRTWISPAGNCFSSLLLRPAVSPAVAAQASFVTALAVAETVAGLLPVGAAIACKWPNDVLVQGRKIAGILLESRTAPGAPGRVEWLIIGTGINVASFPDGLDYPVTALAAEGSVASVVEVLETYAARLDHWLRVWASQGFAPVRTAWLRWADGIGAKVLVRLADGTLEGIFSALDESGALILTLADGSRRVITAGDVFRAA